MLEERPIEGKNKQRFGTDIVLASTYHLLIASPVFWGRQARVCVWVPGVAAAEAPVLRRWRYRNVEAADEERVFHCGKASDL